METASPEAVATIVAALLVAVVSIVGSLGWLLRKFTAPRNEDIAAIRRQVEPNGSELEDDDETEQATTRELVLAVSREQRAHLEHATTQDKRFETHLERAADHLKEHKADREERARDEPLRQVLRKQYGLEANEGEADAGD